MLVCCSRRDSIKLVGLGLECLSAQGGAGGGHEPGPWLCRQVLILEQLDRSLNIFFDTSHQLLVRVQVGNKAC